MSDTTTTPDVARAREAAAEARTYIQTAVIAGLPDTADALESVITHVTAALDALEAERESVERHKRELTLVRSQRDEALEERDHNVANTYLRTMRDEARAALAQMTVEVQQKVADACDHERGHMEEEIDELKAALAQEKTTHTTLMQNEYALRLQVESARATLADELAQEQAAHAETRKHADNALVAERASWEAVSAIRNAELAKAREECERLKGRCVINGILVEAALELPNVINEKLKSQCDTLCADPYVAREENKAIRRVNNEQCDASLQLVADLDAARRERDESNATLACRMTEIEKQIEDGVRARLTPPPDIAALCAEAGRAIVYYEQRHEPSTAKYIGQLRDALLATRVNNSFGGCAVCNRPIVAGSWVTLHNECYANAAARAVSEDVAGLSGITIQDLLDEADSQLKYSMADWNRKLIVDLRDALSTLSRELAALGPLEWEGIISKEPREHRWTGLCDDDLAAARQNGYEVRAIRVVREEQRRTM